MIRIMPGRLRLLIHEYVTGGGLAGQELPPSWAQEGAAMRRALVSDFTRLPGLDVQFTLDARFPQRPRSHAIGPNEEWERLAELSLQVDAVLLIAPETAGVLESRERLIRRLGVPSLGSEPDAIHLAADKLLAAQRLAAWNVPVVPTREFQPQATPPSHPAVVKPRDGAGSIDTWLVPAGKPWPNLNTAAIVQPYQCGLPMSVAALVPPSGPICWIGAATQTVTIIGQRFHYCGGLVPGRFPQSLRRVLTPALRAWPGLAGWVGIDYIWDPTRRQAAVLEINPRLTTSYLGHRARWGEWIAASWLHQAGLGPKPGRRSLQTSTPVPFAADGRINRKRHADDPSE
jgi:predicted ATP-grasp superfamily ATP-dependent carboligase